MSNILAHRAHWIGEGYIYGKLYDVGHYPAAVPDPDHSNIVHGDIYKVDDDNLLSKLDEFEGISPALPQPWEYARESVEAWMDDQQYACWIYRYNWSLFNKNQILHGDYLKYIDFEI